MFPSVCGVPCKIFRVQFFWDFWGPRLGFRNIGKSVALELNFNLFSNVATIFEVIFSVFTSVKC